MRKNDASLMTPLPASFILKKIVSALLMPPVLPLLCIALGLLLLRRRPRIGRMLAWGGLIAVWLFSTPIVVNLMTAPLESVPVLQPEDLERGEVIVILGAGAHRYAPEYDGPTPKRLGLERLRFGARLAHYSGLPVIISGEIVPMAESLQRDFGVRPRWLEGDSLDTEGNARNTARILRAEGLQHVVLVTHAAHMRRAMAEFELQGVAAIPAPTGFLSRQEGDEPEIMLFDYLPSPSAAFAAWYASHEWLGLMALEVRRLMR
jgi:uncharacterized SAM-binding protein YcdF (DUF218 family)